MNTKENKKTDALTLSVMINGLCQLKCPHCFLGESDSSTRFGGGVMSLETAKKLFDAIDESTRGVSTLAVTAMEAFFNKESVAILRYLGEGCRDRNIRFGAITNALNVMTYLDSELASLFSYLDVSFDGGAETYQSYRGVPFQKVIKGIEVAVEKGIPIINTLHTLSDRNIENIDDIMEGVQLVRNISPRGVSWFSFFVWTKNGRNNVKMMSTKETCASVSKSKKFMESDPDACFLVLDDYHFLSRGENPREIYEYLAHSPEISDELGCRIRVFGDPVDEGILRVTVDGLVVHPLELLHGEVLEKHSIGAQSLDDVYRLIREQNKNTISHFYP